ncbi:MAG TPA: UvrD-helicase domain-containing protein [Novosphingobium sp.]|nr:UvrD-helicase domain-containing protein [Burkholderiaceae bacterium]
MMGEDKPWSASLLVAPEPTTAAVRPILRSAMLATRRLDPAELNLGALPGTSRARRHLAALRELWLAHPEVVPADLQNLRDFLGCEAGDPAVLSAVLAEVDCVIIDEFQDTSPIQFAFLWSLASQAPRTLIVGDTKQAVMGFQGADPASPPRSPASSRPRR